VIDRSNSNLTVIRDTTSLAVEALDVLPALAAPMPTVIRGVLFLPPALSVEHGALSVLLDVSGRKVMELLPGANDVRALAPGVYFVRRPETGDGGPGAAIRKVIISK
jgi:hypothetical protein